MFQIAFFHVETTSPLPYGSTCLGDERSTSNLLEEQQLLESPSHLPTVSVNDDKSKKFVCSLESFEHSPEIRYAVYRLTSLFTYFTDTTLHRVFMTLDTN